MRYKIAISLILKVIPLKLGFYGLLCSYSVILSFLLLFPPPPPQKKENRKRNPRKNIEKKRECRILFFIFVLHIFVRWQLIFVQFSVAEYRPCRSVSNLMNPLRCSKGFYVDLYPHAEALGFCICSSIRLYEMIGLGSLRH